MSRVVKLQNCRTGKERQEKKRKKKQNKNIPDLRADPDGRTARGRGVTERRRQQQSAGVRGRRGMVWR